MKFLVIRVRSGEAADYNVYTTCLASFDTEPEAEKYIEDYNFYSYRDIAIFIAKGRID